MARLNKRFLDALTPRAKEFIVFDDEVTGYGVRVLPKGTKSFLVQYRKGHRTRRVTFAKVGTLTPDEARKKARELLGSVAKGENPSEVRRIERKAPTISSLCDRFLKEYVAERCKPRTQEEYRRAVERFIKPAIGTHKINDVERADISELHHKHRSIPYQANRTLGVLSKMFNLAEVWGLRLDGSNPCRHVPKYKEHKRERYLTKTELNTLGQVLREAELDGSEGVYAVAAFRLLILTGCRLMEIQSLKWEYVQGEYLVLPDSKTGARRIPLPQAARAIIEGLDPVEDNPYVIAGKEPQGYVTDLQRPWRRIRKRAGLEDVRIHDLRHTYASNAVAQGMDLLMIGKLLGHSQIQTTMRYAHLADDPIKKAAAEVSSGLADALQSPAPPRLQLVP